MKSHRHMSPIFAQCDNNNNKKCTPNANKSINLAILFGNVSYIPITIAFYADTHANNTFYFVFIQFSGFSHCHWLYLLNGCLLIVIYGARIVYFVCSLFPLLYVCHSCRVVLFQFRDISIVCFLFVLTRAGVQFPPIPCHSCQKKN